MAPFNGVPSQKQQVILAIAPKIPGILSMIGSSYIIYDCIYRTKFSQQHKRMMTTYQRLMIGLCICDVMMSSGFVISTWAMPIETPNVWGAAGNTQSCAAVGFFEQAGLSTALYNGSLSIYFLLRIRYAWHPNRIERIEKWLHIIPILLGIGTMIASLVLDLFNSGIFDCWIAPLPQGCDESWKNDGNTTTCIRGDNASLYQWIFDLIPKWCSILLVTLNMWLTHRAVLLQERRTQFIRGINNNDTNNSNNMNNQIIINANGSGLTNSTILLHQQPRRNVARRLARQSYLYVGALYLTYIPVIITRITELTLGYVYYEMLLTISITIPLQGFWNVIVYLRPRYLKQREEQRHIHLVGRLQSPTETGAYSDSNGQQHTRGIVRSYLNAVSRAVIEGDISDDDDDENENDIIINETNNNNNANANATDHNGAVATANGGDIQEGIKDINNENQMNNNNNHNLDDNNHKGDNSQ